MLIHFGQIYIEPGISFPFSWRFQRYLADTVTALIEPSELFEKKNGTDWELMFRISAKEVITEVEVRGPTVFRKNKDVE